MPDPPVEKPLDDSEALSTPHTIHSPGRRSDGGGLESLGADEAILSSGTVLADRYRVDRWLGSGGSGSVYRVIDQELDDVVALKLLHRSISRDQAYRQRIRSEVRLSRRVSHPNVCRVHDLGQHQGQLFVTMEFLKGRTLRSLLSRRLEHSLLNAPLARKIDVVIQICAGLSAAHRAGVLHRDVKPDNVIIESDRAVLTDFGIASMVKEVTERRLVAGTPGYIAPEVLLGEAFDQRADVFGSAVVAFELLAGRRPFSPKSVDAAIEDIQSIEAFPRIPVGCLPPMVQTAIADVVQMALAMKPDQRYDSADRFAEALARAARGDEPVSVHAETVRESGPHPTFPDALLAEQNTPTTLIPTGVAVTPSRAVRTGLRRNQVRVATALYFRRDGLGASERAGAQSSLPDTGSGQQSRLTFERAVVDLGGTPLSISDDAITAIFGAPIAFGDDAARAARAAQALLELTGGRGRAGIDTGRLLLKLATDGVPSASGEALTRAESLANEALAGEVRATPATVRHLVGWFRATEVHSQVTDAQRSLVIHADNDESAAAGTRRSPIVGRDTELQRLIGFVTNVCETRSCHFALVVGPSGSGKTRLRRAVMEQLQDRREIDWLVARATPFAAASPLSVLRSAHPDWFWMATQRGFRDQAASFAAARRWLELRGTRCPVVLFLEDAQWADEASLELFGELQRTLDNVPVAVVIMMRPIGDENTVGWPIPQDEDSGYLELQLSPLDQESALTIARSVAPGASDGALLHVVKRAAGNPFFIEELARDLAERSSAAETPLSTLPDTVEAVIQARLDRLGPLERELGRASAVMGMEFWRDAARAVSQEPQSISDRDLDEALAELERRSIIYALPPRGIDDDRYSFQQSLVRDVAYQGLAPRDRRRTHAAAAEWLQSQLRSRALRRDHTVVFEIARHLDLGGDRPGAAKAYRQAGEQALKLFAYTEASKALRRAEELTADRDAALFELLGDALQATDSVVASQEAYRSAVELCSDDAVVLARLSEKLGRCCLLLNDNSAALEHYRQGLEYLGADESNIGGADQVMAAALYCAIGWVLGYLIGDNVQGLEYSEKGVGLLEPLTGTTERRELAKALSRLGANYMRAGRWRDQLRCNERNLEIALEIRDLDLQCTALINVGVVHTSLGQYQEAAEYTRRGLAVAIRTGAVGVGALARSNLSGLLMELGQIEDAEVELAEAIRLGSKVGGTYLPEAYGFDARLHALRGDLVGAERQARHALSIALKANSAFDEGNSQRILGLILAHRKDFDGAISALERSAECLKGNDPFEEARSAAAMARVLSLRGRPDDAKRVETLRDSARETFERLGASRDLALIDDDQQIR